MHGSELMKLIFAVLDVSSQTTGLTRCYKTDRLYLHLSQSTAKIKLHPVSATRRPPYSNTTSGSILA